MSLPLLLTLMVLATYRLTRLVVRDDFPPVLWVRDRLAGGWRDLTTKEEEQIAPVRGSGYMELRRKWEVDTEGKQRYVRRHPRSPAWLADLLTCPWCASGWVALGVTLSVTFTAGLPVPLLVWPAVWGAAAVLASREWA